MIQNLDIQLNMNHEYMKDCLPPFNGFSKDCDCFTVSGTVPCGRDDPIQSLLGRINQLGIHLESPGCITIVIPQYSRYYCTLLYHTNLVVNAVTIVTRCSQGTRSYPVVVFTISFQPVVTSLGTAGAPGYPQVIELTEKCHIYI